MSGISYLMGFINFIIYVIVFLFLLRLPLKIGWLALEVLTGMIVHIISSIIGFFLFDGTSYWHQASLYAFLWFCFFFVTSIYSASLSVGIIDYLYKQPQHTASLNDIYQNCVKNVFEQRAEFLILQGLAIKTDHGFIITPKGKVSVQQLQFINNTLGMESRGFYSSDSALMKDLNDVSEK